MLLQVFNLLQLLKGHKSVPRLGLQGLHSGGTSPKWTWLTTQVFRQQILHNYSYPASASHMHETEHPLLAYLSLGSVSTILILFTVAIPPHTRPNIVCLPVNEKYSVIIL